MSGELAGGEAGLTQEQPENPQGSPWIVRDLPGGAEVGKDLLGPLPPPPPKTKVALGVSLAL